MKFAFLNLQNHPRGNLILQELLNNNFIPEVVIEEKSLLASKNRDAIISSFKDTSEKFPLTPDLISDFNIPLFEVNNHNELECENILKKYELDLIILGDTRIIKQNIMRLPKEGIINSHPGYLPDVKGNNPYIWAIINDLPQGCTIHFIDENVDTGDVILRELIDLKKCKSYTDLLTKINVMCSELMIKVVKQIRDKAYSRTPQKSIKFTKNDHIDQEFFAASQEVKNLAINKLQDLIS